MSLEGGSLPPLVTNLGEFKELLDHVITNYKISFELPPQEVWVVFSCWYQLMSVKYLLHHTVITGLVICRDNQSFYRFALGNKGFYYLNMKTFMIQIYLTFIIPEQTLWETDINT